MPPEKCSVINLPVFSTLLDECKCHCHLEQKRAKMLYCPKGERQPPFCLFMTFMTVLTGWFLRIGMPMYIRKSGSRSYPLR